MNTQFSQMAIGQALDGQRYETARRLCLAALDGGAAEGRIATLRLLHRAYRALGDMPAALDTLAKIEAAVEAPQTELLLLRAEDYTLLASDSFYRASAERAAGLSLEEYQDKMRALAVEPLETAVSLGLNGHSADAARLFRELGFTEKAAALHRNGGHGAKAGRPLPERSSSAGAVFGVLRFPGGAPVADALVTLGLAVEVDEADPATYIGMSMGYSPRIGAQSALRARTDADGRYRFAEVPAGRHEFLAVTLDGQLHEVNTRFFAHGVKVQPGSEAVFDATVDEWRSAPKRVVANPFSSQLVRDGVSYRRLHTETWQNPFHFDFPRQLVTWPLPENAGRDTGRLLLLDAEAGEPLGFQLSGDSVVFFASLPACSDRVLALYEAEGAVAPVQSESALRLTVEGETAVLGTGRADFRLAWNEGAAALPPIVEVRGEDGAWRGAGRWVLPPGVSLTGRRCRVLESGPLLLRLEIAYSLSSGREWKFELTAQENEAALLVHETAPPLDGAAFEFSLREFAGGEAGGRGFLHWTPEHGNRHWSGLRAEDRELARLQESIAWWIPPCGFGYAFTADGLAARDYIGVFTLRRGEWKDALFEKLIRGPVNADGTPNVELDWPFPEMVGSTISMITAHTDSSGDAFFHWGAFEGERHWGLLVSTLERNEGPFKEISAVQHKNSSPRLQDFRLWHLDEADGEPRPHVVARRDELKQLRLKKESPGFAPYWEKLQEGVRKDKNGGSTAGFVFAVEGDPLIAWRRKRELVGDARIRSRMTLLGRDYSDMYSPVGARPITYLAEDYDLIAASGVFTPDEERMVRASLMLMGHLYMSTDLMNWRYGSRNANFEADRVDVVGAIGLCFHDNPDSARFLDHVTQLTERSLAVYCTPGSGKWYENPACYYLQASKCRTNLAFHLWRHGIYDASALPRFKEFLRWGILLLTPPRPTDNEAMRDGLAADAYGAHAKRRVIPPLGDHAELGRFVPEHYAFMSLLYRESDPEFADELLWAYQAGGLPGSNFGNLPLVFAAMDEAALAPVPAPALHSRRLQGFGAVLRDHFDAEDELYVLWKQGPGGYRFQRSEGSFMLFANGKPLVYEGGEAGETWRHSTLSFHDVHTPLAPGHVERFRSYPAAGGRSFDFVQGVHAKALAPEDPPHLSDDCDHRLVEVAYRRFQEPAPADVRSLWRVGDDYLVVHDDLNLAPDVTAHWHLHAVADGETSSDEFGTVFQGRFGTDLQVLLPGQNFEQTTLHSLPLHEYDRPMQERFTTRHLCLSGPAPSHYLALLRPLFDGRRPLHATPLAGTDRPAGVRVHGEGIDDVLWFGREARRYEEGPVHFEGRYAAAIRRGGTVQLALLDGKTLGMDGFQLESDGPSIFLQSDEAGLVVRAEGSGEVRVQASGREWTATLDGEKIEYIW